MEEIKHEARFDEETAALIMKTPMAHAEVGPLRQRSPRHTPGIIVAVVLFLWWSFNAIPGLLSIGHKSKEDGIRELRELSFEEIIPNEKLVWHPCYRDIGTYQCARLTVPMDYKRPLNASANNPKVHIALLLVPGIHAGSKPYSTSPLLINPGGPGGSGVVAALVSGSHLQQVVGEDRDIIGFDPRGVGSTTPRADCFAFPYNDDTEEDDYVRGQYHRLLWQVAGSAVGAVNTSNVALEKVDTRARAVSKLCAEKDAIKGEDSIFRHVSTPSVARDMLSIVDAWDEWTAKFDAEEISQEAEKTTEDGTYSFDTKGKLVYWGFSYGTLLGATFSAMFPDRVGRVVLDGVVDADHYVAPVWVGSLRDTDKASKSFSTYCHAAEGACALWRPNDTSTNVEDRLQAVFEGIKQHPISLIGSNNHVPMVIQYTELRMLMFMTLYSPTESFHILAIILDLLHRGLTEILSEIFSWPDVYELHSLCRPPASPQYSLNEATYAIMCSDKRYELNETLDHLENIYKDLAKSSSWADIWMTIMLGCDGWKIKAVDPPMRWDDQPTHKLKPINTSFPILFIGNTADPVTPLHAAIKMAGKFVDAGLIEQKSEGHCSLAAVSRCTLGKVHAYFNDGKIPSPPDKKQGKWEVCEADEWPFHSFSKAEWLESSGVNGKADVERMEAFKEMQKVLSEGMKLWGQPSMRLKINRTAAEAIFLE